MPPSTVTSTLAKAPNPVTGSPKGQLPVTTSATSPAAPTADGTSNFGPGNGPLEADVRFRVRLWLKVQSLIVPWPLYRTTRMTWITKHLNSEPYVSLGTTSSFCLSNNDNCPPPNNLSSLTTPYNRDLFRAVALH